MSNSKYSKKRTRNNIKELYNTQTQTWETFVNSTWNLSVWNSITDDETVKFSNSNSSSSSCDSGYYSSSSSSDSSSSYDSGSCGGSD